MSWLMSGGELLAGIVTLIVWWLTVELLKRRNLSTTSFRVAFLPPMFLLWAVAGAVMVLRGLRVL
jgi:hypothetical protein